MKVVRDLSGPLTGSATLPPHPKPLPQMSLLARRSGPTSTPTPAGSGYSLLDAQLVVPGIRVAIVRDVLLQARDQLGPASAGGCVIVGAITFGRTCTKISRALVAPVARAASM